MKCLHLVGNRLINYKSDRLINKRFKKMGVYKL